MQNKRACNNLDAASSKKTARQLLEGGAYVPLVPTLNSRIALGQRPAQPGSGQCRAGRGQKQCAARHVGTLRCSGSRPCRWKSLFWHRSRKKKTNHALANTHLNLSTLASPPHRITFSRTAASKHGLSPYRPVIVSPRHTAAKCKGNFHSPIVAVTGLEPWASTEICCTARLQVRGLTAADELTGDEA
jgi:hypothetical protein